jgi:O-antigen/teichoic acid export membrane protein
METEAASGSPQVGADDGTGRRVLRNTVFTVAGDAASKLGLFVLYAVIARSLGKGGFGDYTLAVSLAFFVRASALGIDLILSREVARDLENAHGLMWETIVVKLAAGTAVLAGVVVYAAASGYSHALIVAVALIGVSNVIDVVGLSVHAVLKGRELMGPPAKALTLETSIIAALGAVALLVFDGGLVALGVVYLIAAVIGLAYIIVAMRRRGIHPRRTGGTRGKWWLARAAVPTGIAAFFGAALARLDAVILAAMTHDSGIVGLYGGAYRIFEATLFVNWAFGVAVYPMLSRLQKQSASLKRAFEVSTKAITAATMPLAGAMALFGPTIIEAVLGSEFAGGGTATRILGGATVLYAIFTVPALTVAGQDRQDLFPWMGGAALAVNVALNVILIPPLGLNGSAIAMTAAQGVATGIMFAFAVRQTGAVSPVRMFASPLAGLGAMALVALLLGSGGIALALSLLAYGPAFLAVERVLFRADLDVFVRALRRRGGAGRDHGMAAARAR